MSDHTFIDSKSAIRRRIYYDLLQRAIPDSRYGYDFTAFYPDFRDSSFALNRITGLSCYQSADTIFITPDNSLEALRHQALKDGKKALVPTYAMRRGFFVLDPRRISDQDFRFASLLDGMERPGIGRSVEVAQLKEEIGKIDLCVTGAGAVDARGRRLGNGRGFFDLAWAILSDRGIVGPGTPVAAVVHECQIVDEEQHPEEWDVRCDFVATQDKLISIESVEQPEGGVLWDKLKPEQWQTISVLQELKGIQMMEKIMNGTGSLHELPKPTPNLSSADELMGIQMMEQIMRDYKI
ncbi:nagb/rpia/CoA transferase-like protein [Lojkania enalia]|uniref:Nagb/rpia/CoA transferase-like protein n=1 Tax=Lojkania enalia TaxID=147567 RepID=A0A9P4K987_9PLEO|nr:nagb/rpia/CoA transferase-like protein [Didymosphaeria enalia]